MVYCSDIADFLEQLAPGELAEEWDNNGLLIGDREKEIKSIMVCLDVTRASLEAAVERDADLVVTHHPVIFKGLKRLNGDDAKGEIIISLIRSGINVYSAHTNLDFARFGVNTQLAAALGLHDTEIMGRGPGRFGSLERRMSLNEFADHVKSRLSTPHLRVTGNADSGVGKVAVFGGSFDDDLEAFAGTGADVLVTGDLKYHTALDASEAGLCIVDAGHFNTEKTVLPYLTEALSQRFPDISVTRFEGEKDPFISY